MKKSTMSLFLSVLLVSTSGFAFGKKITGAWELVSWEKQVGENQWASRCNSPKGFIVYAKSGQMSVGMNCMKPNSSEPTFDASDAVFYSGTYDFDGSSMEVVHNISTSSDAVFYGKKLKRDVTFTDDKKMILSGLGKSGVPVRMVWKKAERVK